VVCLLDMTERKRLEHELWAAQRMEAIGHLTGGVAHDFNNLLMVIGSYAGFVQDQLAPGSTALEDVQVIKEATDRAAALTQQLLAFGRRQLQQLELMDLNNVVSELEKMLRRVIGAHIRFSTSLASGLGLVKADKLQIEQILMNLCVNARDAMPDGGQMAIATANASVDAAESRRLGGEVPPGAYVRLSVTDDGIGMDAAVRARIFEPFFTTKERGRGPGLGLSTVYGIVKQSQGHIWVESQPGKGACFAIYLPRLEERSAIRDPQRHSSAPERRATVLVVEDEELVRTAARRILELSGYRVLEAAHGHAALELCEQRPELAIELVVTDIVMPEMNGQELARRLAVSRPNIKVIYVSGYADDALPHHGSLAPPTAYLQKPFTPDTLLTKVREVLGE
jgi:nitrogen-specific signal transduction histidine kinase/ActR/RegA family two-component response regulator